MIAGRIVRGGGRVLATLAATAILLGCAPGLAPSPSISGVSVGVPLDMGSAGTAYFYTTDGTVFTFSALDADGHARVLGRITPVFPADFAPTGDATVSSAGLVNFSAEQLAGGTTTSEDVPASAVVYDLAHPAAPLFSGLGDLSFSPAGDRFALALAEQGKIFDAQAHLLATLPLSVDQFPYTDLNNRIYWSPDSAGVIVVNGSPDVLLRIGVDPSAPPRPVEIDWGPTGIRQTSSDGRSISSDCANLGPAGNGCAWSVTTPTGAAGEIWGYEPSSAIWATDGKTVLVGGAEVDKSGATVAGTILRYSAPSVATVLARIPGSSEPDIIALSRDGRFAFIVVTPGEDTITMRVDLASGVAVTLPTGAIFAGQR